MAASEKALNPNESNERLWRTSQQTNVSDEGVHAYREAAGRKHKVSETNISDTERIVSGVGGGALAAYGLSRGDWVGVGLLGLGAVLLQRGVRGYCDIYGAMGVNTAEKQNATSVKASSGVKVEKAVTINAPVEEIYQYWRAFENLPKFMRHLESVKKTDEMRSHWKAKAPLGYTVEWDAEIISDIPNEMISWRSVENADVPNAGSVHFNQSIGGRGTVVKVSLKYDPPAGKLGAALAWLFGEEPSVQVQEDLRRFKNLIEADEIPTTKGQSSARPVSTTIYDKE